MIEDLEHIVPKFGIKGIFLLDDNFFVSLKRVERICELIIEKGIDVRFYNVNCRLDTLARSDMNFLRLMKSAGIHSLFVGVESASPAVLKAMKKSVNVEDIFSIDKKLQSSGIVPTYSFMVGLPVENTDDISQTLLLMCKIIEANPNACLSPQVYIPLPGSKLCDMCVERGLVLPDSLREWAHFCENHPQDLVRYCWFDEKEREFLRKVALIKQVIDTKSNKRKTASKELLRNIYSSIIRFRIKHNFYDFMPELRLRDVGFLKLKEKRN